MSRALQGVGVLITRPIEQASGLARAVEVAGGRAILYPAVKIVPAPTTQIAAQLRAARDAVDLIFISPTAARIGVPLLDLPSPNPPGRRYFAVGDGTARELKNFGLQPVIAPPHGADSEALLGLPQLQNLSGRRMAIIRGDGGRELLRRTLQSRAADVIVVECYKRELPAESLPAAVERDVQAVTVTSSEIVSNLFRLVGPNSVWLSQVPFFVSHPRVGRRAAQWGVRTVCVARADAGASADQALADAMSAWFAGQSPFAN